MANYQPNFQRGWSVIIKRYVPINNEYAADAAITPGHFLALTATGVAVQATAGGKCMGVATEDELQGRSMDDAYEANDPVQVWTPRAGDEVRAILKNGATVAQGAYLKVDVGGVLVAGTATDAIAVAIAPADASAAVAGEIVRVEVRIL